jgi:hypothetical protein
LVPFQKGLKRRRDKFKKFMRNLVLALKGPFSYIILKRRYFKKKFEAGEELNQFTFSGCSPPALN